MKEELAEVVKEALDTNPRNFSNHIHSRKHRHLIDWIYANTPEKIDFPQYKMATRIQWILHGTTDFPVCKRCGKQFGMNQNIRINAYYQEYCPKCSHCTPEANKKREETCLRKYGTTNPSYSKMIKDKIKDTNMKKYGSACPINNPEVRKKTEATILERYGVTHYSMCDEYKEKVRNTCQERYGADSPLQSKDVREKIRLTLLEKYGVEHSSQAEITKKHTRETMLRRYGEKWGKKLFQGNSGQHRRAYRFMLASEDVEPLFDEEYYLDNKSKDPNFMFRFRCKHCNNEYESVWDNGQPRHKCPFCPKLHGKSMEEKTVIDFIRSIYDGNIMENTRQIIRPNELDIFIPDLNLAIEYTGIFWHNDLIRKDHRCHQKKLEQCLEKNIDLITLFENEWLNQRCIVESNLTKRINPSKISFIDANDCTIRQVDDIDSEVFLTKNHLRGYVGAHIRLGLYFNDELVSIMTFSKPRFSKKYEWEILRYCDKTYTTVTNGTNRLLLEFEQQIHPESIVGYADRRWSNGNIYKNLGFELVSKTRPNYWYFKNNHVDKLYSRLLFQKHLQASKLEIFDESLSEIENMRNNKFHRIFDCGNLVFLKRY